MHSNYFALIAACDGRQLLSGPTVRQCRPERPGLVGSRHERERCEWQLSVRPSRQPTFRNPSKSVAGRE
ncbi:hypothetical protein, partial [Gluconobacter potus]|uniref:hypothetical protein n=1 Tax=Gluconobacter potus TaxID=2724927 RepID=UPI001E299413